MSLQNTIIRHKSKLITSYDLKFSLPVLTLVLILGMLIEPLIGHIAVGIFFMIVISITGLFVTRLTIFGFGFLLILFYDYLIFPPTFTLRVDESKDFATTMALFIAAVGIAELINRLKNQASVLRLREQDTQMLFTLARQLAQTQSLDDIAQISCTSMRDLLNHGVALLLIQSHEIKQRSRLEWHAASQFQPTPIEADEVLKAFDAARTQQNFDFQRTSTGKTFLPLIGREGLVGILLLGKVDILLESPEKLRLAATFSHQIALAIERENYHSRSNTLEIMENTQKLYKTLLNSVSHELKTPLVSIIGSASALIDEQSSRDSNLVQSLASEILTASQRLRGVVENLLDMSRIDSGMLKPRREACDIRDLLAIVVQRLEIEGHPHCIKLDIPSDIPEIWVDPVLVDQALGNIINNARIYSPPDSAIEISARAHDEQACIAIRDHGPGLSPEQPERVFNKFYRGSPQNPGGLGLGLAIAQGFIEAQGGRIEATNHAQGGAIFTVCLPCYR